MAWRRCDDRDGSLDDIQPVDVGFDGKVYVLHLGPANRAAIRADIAPWIEGIEPRRSMGAIIDHNPDSGAGPRPARPRPRGPRTDLLEVRKWAAANGYAVKGVGQVPKDVLKAYDNRS